MNHDEIRELAAMYVLGGLDGEDRARFEALLRSADRDATAALADFESALVNLAAEAAETPPPSVRAALMERIVAEAPPIAVAPPRRSRSVLWPLVWGAVMAAGLAALAVGLSMSSSYEKRLAVLARESEALKADIRREQQVIAMLRDPATQIVALSGLQPAPSARARMIWNEHAGGLLVAAGLPPTPAGKTYQLWAIVGKNPPISAGVFTVDAKGAGSLRVAPLTGVGTVDVFAVTLEPAGGRPAPSGQMYLAGKA
jgi:anti-sigma-K factor RskA